MSSFYAYDFMESELVRGKPIYRQVFEFIVDYIKNNGGRRGAFVEAAKHFYPRLYREKPRYAVKLVYEHFRYARRKFWNKHFGTFWSEPFGTSGTGFGTDMIDETIEMNMGYYVENHSGPIHDKTRFIKDSEKDRQLFEFKKMIYAVLKDLVKPKSTLTNYVETLTRDPRVRKTLGDNPVWYNGKNYVKLDRRQAALLYIVIHRIYTMHHGSGGTPKKLIEKFFEVTGYGPRDLGEELRELTSIFYDWLLFL